MAAPLYSRRGTVLTGLASVAVVLAIHIRLGIVYDTDALTEVATVATVAVLAVLINLLVRRSSEQLASAREIAEAAQRAVLPEPAGRIGGFEIAARYEAAQEGAFIGGDLYAVQDTPHGVRLVVGDVRGKGMGAVAAVAVVIGAFREAAEQEATLEAVAQRLERALAREGTRRDGLDAFEGFTTAVLAELPHGDGVVRIVDRGIRRRSSSKWTAPYARCRSGSPHFPWEWGDGGLARPGRGVRVPGRGHPSRAHRRAVRGAGLPRGLLRPGGAAGRADLPYP